jgi:nucleoside-diphosphate-sugar epimerase
MVAWNLAIILGLGFTGTVLARRLLSRGVPVFGAVRGAGRFADLAAAGMHLAELSTEAGRIGDFPRNAAVFYSIPPVGPAETIELFHFLQNLEPARVVYISSTAVYGDQISVDENTLAQPNDERGRARLAAEEQIAAGPWTTLILRAAAIYGPGRGVHTAIREGRLPRSAGSGIVSRIHVEDLAALSDAGLQSDLQGAWPVADDAPCSSAEIAEWCVKFFGMESASEKLESFQIAGRRVDGRRIRELLGVRLKYPNWEAGLRASIAEEITRAKGLA